MVSFAALSLNYPSADDAAVVKQLIGGAVNADWITNTCAIRMSRALNYSGLPVPAGYPGLHVVSGGDKKHYAFRMKELSHWLAGRLGKPTIVAERTATAAIDRATFAGKQGIISFDIHFSDASGHIDLWDGKTFIHERIAGKDYFALASRVVLWVLA